MDSSGKNSGPHIGLWKNYSSVIETERTSQEKMILTWFHPLSYLKTTFLRFEDWSHRIPLFTWNWSLTPTSIITNHTSRKKRTISCFPHKNRWIQLHIVFIPRSPLYMLILLINTKMTISTWRFQKWEPTRFASFPNCNTIISDITPNKNKRACTVIYLDYAFIHYKHLIVALMSRIPYPCIFLSLIFVFVIFTNAK